MQAFLFVWMPYVPLHRKAGMVYYKSKSILGTVKWEGTRLRQTIDGFWREDDAKSVRDEGERLARIVRKALAIDTEQESVTQLPRERNFVQMLFHSMDAIPSTHRQAPDKRIWDLTLTQVLKERDMPAYRWRLYANLLSSAADARTAPGVSIAHLDTIHMLDATQIGILSGRYSYRGSLLTTIRVEILNPSDAIFHHAGERLIWEKRRRYPLISTDIRQKAILLRNRGLLTIELDPAAIQADPQIQAHVQFIKQRIIDRNANLYVHGRRSLGEFNQRLGIDLHPPMDEAALRSQLESHLHAEAFVYRYTLTPSGAAFANMCLKGVVLPLEEHEAGSEGQR